jgi:Rps23 Pro-64 3,4-dihydroxylase Tpa1-like proline 4-hydroxylase
MKSALATSSISAKTSPILQLGQVMSATAQFDPYPYLMASNCLSPDIAPALGKDFPDIKKNGYLPLSLLKREGMFDALLRDLEGPEIAAILSDKLGLELRDKPRMITVRKWSAGNDGRIHNDGEAKICTSLIYLNEAWPEGDAGRLRVLRSEHSFDDTAAEVPPVFGTFFAFKRTENSWHGHKPFTGERRVIQTTWLRSWDDFDRKEKRGRFAFLLKRLLSSSY